jgi:hypothetical protein
VSNVQDRSEILKGVMGDVTWGFGCWMGGYWKCGYVKVYLKDGVVEVSTILGYRREFVLGDPSSVEGVRDQVKLYMAWN